jgi:hypothetical protein
VNYTEAHVHHLAKKAHGFKSKLESVLGKRASVVERVVSTLEITAGAWGGGLLEGRTAGGTFHGMPLNLIAGVVLNAAGYFGEGVFGEVWAPHLNNFGDGFVASWAAAHGFTFGQRWQQTGKFFGGVATPAALPAAAAAPVAPPVSQGEMDAIINRMAQVARQGG